MTTRPNTTFQWPLRTRSRSFLRTKPKWKAMMVTGRLCLQNYPSLSEPMWFSLPMDRLSIKLSSSRTNPKTFLLTWFLDWNSWACTITTSFTLRETRLKRSSLCTTAVSCCMLTFLTSSTWSHLLRLTRCLTFPWQSIATDLILEITTWCCKRMDSETQRRFVNKTLRSTPSRITL